MTLAKIDQGFLNLANGNPHLEFPVGTFEQRGKLKFSAKLVYDGRIYQVVNGAWQPTNVANSQGGWRFVTTADPGFVTDTLTSTTCNPGQFIQTWQAFTWTDSDGTERVFPITTTENQCTGSSTAAGDAFAQDSSGFHMYVTNFTSATVFAKDGTEVYPTVKDTNGNFFSVDGSGNVVDSLNRIPVTKTVNGNITYYDVLNSQGSTSRFTVTTTTVNANTAFGQTGVSEYSGSFTVVQSIGLPDGTSYSFTYDSGTTPGFYGLLKSMTVRTGGTVNYTWTNFSDGYGNINRWLKTRKASGTWTYSPSVVTTCAPGTTGCQQQVSLTKPSGDQTWYTFTLNNGAWNIRKKFFNGNSGTGTLLKTITNDFDFTNACPISGCFGNAYIRRIRATTTDPVPSGNVIKKTEFTYDSIFFGNFSAVKKWYYYTGTPPAAPDQETDYLYLTDPAYAAKDIHDRVTSVTIKNAAGTQLSQTLTGYDTGTLTSIAGITHHDDANFGTGNTTRGNPTQTQRWISGTAFLTTTKTHDTTGQLLTVTNPRGHTRSYDYTDNFFTDANPPVNPPATFTPSAPTNAFVTLITFNETQGSGHLHFGYYFGSSKPAEEADTNLAEIYHHYLDPFDRESHRYERKLINGTRGWTLNVYTSATVTDVYRGITDTTASPSCNSCRHDEKILDSFGRPINSTIASDPGGAVKEDTAFDNNNRALTESNPYRSTSDPTYGIESETYDGLDRVTAVTHADSNVAHTYFGAAVSSAGGIGSQLCSTTTFGFGYPILTADEVGKKLQKWANPFGSIIEVDEPDSTNALTLPTCYRYDGLQNNTQIVQGSQTRSYAYDGISRKTSGTEPESGTTNYFYTTSTGSICSGADDICRKTDARGVTATYTYDVGSEKDRLTSISYSDGTSTSQYFHDQSSFNGLTIQYGGDRLTGMSDGSGQTAWSYDPAGHIVTERRSIGSVTENTFYTYNLDGSIASITYPSGRIVNYTYNNAQQAVSVVDGNGTNYVTGATYAPQGALASVVHGQVSGGFAGVTETYSYNNRLQIATHVASSSNGTVLNQTYGYGTANNSDILSVTNNLNTGRSQSFTYDNMNRLVGAESEATAGADCWGDSYGYDSYGNLLAMTVTKCSGQNLNMTVDGNNHIVGMSYNAAGDLTNDGTLSYTWDAENRLTSTAGTNYAFDGKDLRVMKGGNDLYWYSAASCQHPLFGRSTTLGTYTDEFVHFNGQPVAYVDDTAGQTYHYINDQLGSPRVMTDGTGATQFETDYYPLGGERVITENKDSLLKFRAKEEDPESGLENTRQMYQPSLGRFAAPSRIAKIPSLPTLNRLPARPVPLNAVKQNHHVVAPGAPFGNPQALNAYGASDFFASGSDNCQQCLSDCAGKWGVVCIGACAVFIPLGPEAFFACAAVCYRSWSGCNSQCNVGPCRFPAPNFGGGGGGWLGDGLLLPICTIAGCPDEDDPL